MLVPDGVRYGEIPLYNIKSIPIVVVEATMTSNFLWGGGGGRLQKSGNKVTQSGIKITAASWYVECSHSPALGRKTTAN